MIHRSANASHYNKEALTYDLFNEKNSVELNTTVEKILKKYRIKIGNKNYVGRGFGANTLSQFTTFFRQIVDRHADTFMIDPATDNPKAKHVYLKAGFKHIGNFIMTGVVSGAGKPHHLLIKKFPRNTNL
jgi:RimJ/RimL family protein N-acetyltransferase